MGKPYPLAFRKRVVAAVESGDLSCNQAAKQFGIGISTAIGWVNRLRKTGSLAPGQMGGHKPKAISGEHRVWLLQRTKNGDFTLRGLVAELGEHGLKVPLGVGVCPCREAQLQKKAWRLANGNVPTSRTGERNG
jgi:transposase